MAEAGVEFPLVNASAEAVPLPDASFDIVFCDHGAMSFADPYRTVPEAARLLRPGGQFAFNHHSPIQTICWPLEAEEVGERLALDYFGMHAIDDGEDVSFQLPYGEWIRLFRDNGFAIEGLIEPRPEADATSSYRSASGAGMGAPLAVGMHLAAAPRVSPAAQARAGSVGPRPAQAAPGGSGRRFDQAVQIARPVELDERLAPSTGPDLPIRHDRVARQRSAVGRPAGQLTLVQGRPDAGHDPRAPLAVPLAVVPAVDRRPGQAHAAEGHVEQGKASMTAGHDPTVPVPARVARRCEPGHDRGTEDERRPPAVRRTSVAHGRARAPSLAHEPSQA